jgi:hypothetical protein
MRQNDITGSATRACVTRLSALFGLLLVGDLVAIGMTPTLARTTLDDHFTVLITFVTKVTSLQGIARPTQ